MPTMPSDTVRIVCALASIGPVSGQTEAAFWHPSLDDPFMLPRAMITIDETPNPSFVVVALPRWKAEALGIDWQADHDEEPV